MEGGCGVDGYLFFFVICRFLIFDFFFSFSAMRRMLNFNNAGRY